MIINSNVMQILINHYTEYPNYQDFTLMDSYLDKNGIRHYQIELEVICDDGDGYREMLQDVTVIYVGEKFSQIEGFCVSITNKYEVIVHWER